MRIDVWFDLVCPFCHLGKRQLELALDRFEHRDDVEVIWHSYELDRHAPRVVDTPTIDLVATKYGASRDQMVAQHESMAQQAAALGLDFNWQQMVSGNSYDAHRLVHLGRARGREADVLGVLMAAWFSHGAALGDRDTLLRLGVEAGLADDDVRDLLDSDDYGIEVRTDEALAGQLGIQGVPMFVLDQKYGMSGAQGADALLAGLRQAWDEQGERPPAPAAGGCGEGCACGAGGCAQD